MKYRKGYCAITVSSLELKEMTWLKEAAQQCEQFVVGIPNAQIMEEIDTEQKFDIEETRDCLLDLKWISDVLILNVQQLDYQKIYEEIQFDVCFYGSGYGSRFQQDVQFMSEHDISFEPLLPSKIIYHEVINTLDIALEYCEIKKIILFGVNSYFDYYMKFYGNRYRPAYAVDNAVEKWDSQREGISIKNPAEIANENPTEVYIIICIRNYKSAAAQIQKMGSYDYCTLLCRPEIACLEYFCNSLPKKKDVWDTLKKIQQINYDMLEEFDRVCRQHDVQYFLNYGSLLGAIRHEGFIPWDNDIDTAMTREDYEKLSQHKDEFDDRYYWLPIDRMGNKKYYDCVPRLGYKAAYIRLDEEVCRFYENQNNRIHLDMFLIDKTYDNFQGKCQRRELAILYGLMNAYRHKSFFFDYNKKMRFANAIMRVVGRCIPLPWLKKRADKVARRFNKDADAPYYFISNDSLRKLSILFPKEIFDHSVNLKFGRLDVQAACGYDKMCRMIFGDYMKLPPKKNRVPHLGRLLITSDLYVFEEPDESQ
ncbi:MAG: LicD family protein [Ruminococcus flavefaciens]|nr:LicD family protein [Ruminococcus flavefaciens]